ncbi:MAG: hypothetical protein Q8J78_06295, partial [Moraxellaceae bacterium]|nr:hypothetical protein [Moraxellaceae bacterium]
DEIPGKAFRLVVARRDSDAGAVARCWSWFRYITKQLGGEEKFTVVKPGGNRVGVPVRDVFKPWPARSGGSIECAQLAGGSHSIWTKAQLQVDFRSWLTQRQFDRMYAGEEIEFFRRDQERMALPEQWAPGFSLRS